MCLYLTYEGSKQVEGARWWQARRKFVSYLWGIETLIHAFLEFGLRSSLYLTYEGSKRSRWARWCYIGNIGLYLTYEGSKQTKCSLKVVKLLPSLYLTYEGSKLSFNLLKKFFSVFCLYLTYEGSKLYFLGAVLYTTPRFVSYLWGIETCFSIIEVEIRIHVCILPMRDRNLNGF